ncbi:MAG: type I glyceraldehyde-3-phosphate dehydrogenase [Micromonosporaceae bacterium]|jgi:glyceraldehyde 3-phosphate dehydrogenase
MRLGINGVGRIGRNLWRAVHLGAPDVEVVAVNDTADPALIAHLLRYDSVRGRFPGTVRCLGDAIEVDGTAVPITGHPTPDRIDWARYGVDVVIEATGQFTRGDAARGHLAGGAPLVVISTASPDADVCLMMGINEHVFDPARHRVVSNSCCTTYCVATIAGPLDQAYGIRDGTLTAAYSAGSRPGPLLDGVHPNLRMARANATTIVPAGIPGVRHALGRVMPQLAGRIAATALRVPVTTASVATLVLRLARRASAAEVNAVLEAAAGSVLKGYLEVSHEPLVSADVVGRPASCVVDAALTAASGDLVRVVGWYDNEWGYAHRLLDLARYLHQQARGAGLTGGG